jgi:hypothetical protein
MDDEMRRLREGLSPEGLAWWEEAQRLHSPPAEEERLGEINRWAAGIAFVPRQDHDALARLLTLASKAEREASEYLEGEGE